MALQATTDALAHVTHLLALVTAPPLRATVVRRAEVLMLQPSTVVCVVITSTGDVSKHVATFDAPVDPGLADWAREYLNEQVAGLALGARLLRNRFGDPGLSPREREFLAALEPAFTELVERGERAVYVGGTASVMGEFPADDIGAFRNLLEALERRAALLELTRAALVNRKPFVRVGSELDDPAFVRVSLVGAPYGLARRNLGTVSLIGPTRMDYGRAIGAVRAAAIELSRFVEGVYDE